MFEILSTVNMHGTYIRNKRKGSNYIVLLVELALINNLLNDLGK